MTPQQRITAAEAAVTALAGMTETRSITPVYLAAVLTKMIEICIDELADRQSVDADLTQTCQTLSQSISTETSAREEAIEDEVMARNQAIATAKTTLEQALASAVSTLNSTIAAEETRAKEQEQANTAAITAANQMLQLAVQTITAAIEAEKSERQAGDADNTAALGAVDDKVKLDDKLTAALLALLERRIAAIEESVKNGFASLIVDNLSVKVGMKAYMFNGENDDDALVVVRAYAPNFIPKCYAQRWFDTAAKKWYKPTGLTSISDWVVDN